MFLPEQFGSLSDLLSPELLSVCLQRSGAVTLRKCRLPLDMMVWNMVGMALYRHQPMSQIVNQLDILFPGNHTARQCLGEAPVHEVFEQIQILWQVVHAAYAVRGRYLIKELMLQPAVSLGMNRLMEMAPALVTAQIVAQLSACREATTAKVSTVET